MREKKIIQTSLIAIVMNLLLVAFKMGIGLIANSLSIILDAVNNLSDALSSIITIGGTTLSKKTADKEHPYGHGRYEYIAALIVAFIILYAGIQSVIETIKLWLHPSQPKYSWWSVLIVTVAIFVKIFLGNYVQQVGIQLDSPSLKNSGQDAKNDSLLSVATLMSALSSLWLHFEIDKYVSVVIALFILKSGYDILNETLSRILGERISSSLTSSVIEAAKHVPGVCGVYDLFINDYGPNRWIGSLHVEVEDTTSASQIDQLSRKVMRQVYIETGVTLSAVGIYTRNSHSEEVNEMRTGISKYCLQLGFVKQVHGFLVDQENKRIRFDIVVPFGIKSLNQKQMDLKEWIKKEYPGYAIDLTIDPDTTD
ncbi:MULTISPECIES: cation diffusion facilitator family transporter [Terrabacteria group]|uniref:cation diffusion facilitator family transporter n=1 Tax=Bacillati TaxID=1783272 RepID=UPI001C6EB04D|nr:MULTISPECIES: cation diffusion facilitator family transporter [Terrabacteria group]MBW9212584.1 cation diffusion facilitator family transporter [Trueperella sp. zg.1013]